MRFTIEKSVEIQSPVEAVFAFAGDYRNDPRWRAGVLTMEHEPPGPPTINTVTTETMQMLGRRAVTVAEVVEFESCSRTAFRSVSGPIACEGSRLFEATAVGTLFTYTLTLKPAGVLKLLSVFLKPLLAKQVQGDVERLQNLMEAAENTKTSAHDNSLSSFLA